MFSRGRADGRVVYEVRIAALLMACSGELLNLSPSQCNITGIIEDKLGRYSHTALISKGYL